MSGIDVHNLEQELIASMRFVKSCADLEFICVEWNRLLLNLRFCFGDIDQPRNENRARQKYGSNGKQNVSLSILAHGKPSWSLSRQRRQK